MDNWVQWGITSILTILGFLAGRYWSKIDRRIDHDKKVLAKINELLPWNGSILFIREHDFGGSFDVEKLNDFENIHEIETNPNLRFINNELEGMRIRFIKNLINFDITLGTESFSLKIPGRRLNRIRKEEELKDPKDFFKTREKLNNLANQACKTYDDFINKANKTLA